MGGLARALLLSLALLAPARTSPPAPPPVRTHLLYLNSYDQRMIWAQDILRAVEQGLRPEEHGIVLHVLNMDTKQHHDAAYTRALADLLAVKYRDVPIRLILCSDNNALDFLKTYRDRLFPGVPAVFCGINDFSPGLIAGFPDFTGVAEVDSARDTAELALRLHPGTREIFFVSDHLETGRRWLRVAQAELAGLPVHLRFNADLPLQELQQELAALRPGTVVILGAYYADRDGLSFTYEETSGLLAQASAVPVYGLLSFQMGRGVVGGRFISASAQGEAMAGLARRILAGEDPRAIPPLAGGSANPVLFDHRQLKRFGIPGALLPKGSQVLFRPESLYRTYWREIWAIGAFILLLVAALATVATALGRSRRAEQELRASERRLRQLAEASWEGMVIHDRGAVLQANGVFREMFGLREEDLHKGDLIPVIFAPSSRDEVLTRIQAGSLEPYQVTGVRRDGTEFPLELRVRRLDYEGRDVRVAAFRDLTEQKRMEERLTQSQKMEAIGTLAGGIAHDFNNILSAIFGYAELLLMDAPEGSELHQHLGQLLKAATRAKDLVRQILTFSRQTRQELELIQLGPLVKETMKMLRASLPSTIEIHCEIQSEAAVLADATQLHQVLMNLCTNAGLAMKEKGGLLDVHLSDLVLDETSVAFHQGLRPGRYLRLSVSDTGCGMDPELKRRIFEPFFTTRPPGEGTGLGLSVVHGIVQSLHGSVSVYSEPGKGTTFKIFLPVQAPEASVEATETLPLPTGSERVLFVDDETFQVDLATRILSRLGYRMTACSSSQEALARFEAEPHAFDLLITDMTMPGMTGDLLVERVRRIREDLPVILCTGYSERISQDRATRLGIQAFVMKPVVLEEFARKIRGALDSPL